MKFYNTVYTVYIILALILLVILIFDELHNYFPSLAEFAAFLTPGIRKVSV